MIGELRSRVDFPVYQERYGDEVWSVLEGGKDDIIVYDRCGRLVEHIDREYSYLGYDFVSAAIVRAYYEEPCGRCGDMELDDRNGTIYNVTDEDIVDEEDDEMNTYLTQLEREVEDMEEKERERQNGTRKFEDDDEWAEFDEEEEALLDDSSEEDSSEEEMDAPLENPTRAPSKEDNDWWKVKRLQSVKTKLIGGSKSVEKHDKASSSNSASIEQERVSVSMENTEEDKNDDKDWWKVETWSSLEEKKKRHKKKEEETKSDELDSSEIEDNFTKPTKLTDKELLKAHIDHDETFPSDR